MAFFFGNGGGGGFPFGGMGGGFDEGMENETFLIVCWF
jgi:hypothetical protein